MKNDSKIRHNHLNLMILISAFVFGINNYNFKEMTILKNWPLNVLDRNLWLQESPIQFFASFFVNLIIEPLKPPHNPLSAEQTNNKVVFFDSFIFFANLKLF